MTEEERNERITAAALAFAQVAILGYVALRLLGVWRGEPSPKAVYGGVHIAFFWRGATSLWWGSLAALAAWNYPDCRKILTPALPAVVLLSVCLAFLFP